MKLKLIIKISIYFISFIFISFNFCFALTPITSQVSSGINLTTTYDLSLTPGTVDDTFYNVVKSDSLNVHLKNSDSSLNFIKYTHTSLDTTDYSKNIKMSIVPLGNPISSICNSSYSNFDCQYNYTNTDLENRYYYSFLFCNENNLCLSNQNSFYGFQLSQLELSEQIHTGFFLTMQSILTTNIPPSYIDPTPYNNSIFISNNITIKINDQGNGFTWTNVTINGVNYSMTDNLDGTFSYSIIPTTKLNYSFQAYSETNIFEQRKIKIIPDYSTTTELSGYGIIAGLISLIIIIFGGRRKNEE